MLFKKFIDSSLGIEFNQSSLVHSLDSFNSYKTVFFSSTLKDAIFLLFTLTVIFMKNYF